VEAHRDYPDDPQPQWYAGDQGWDPRGGDGRPADGGFRVPEPRGGEAPEQRFGAHVGAEARYGEGDRFGGRYAESDPLGGQQSPSTSFPGFATGRPAEPGAPSDLAATPLSPAAYPTVPPPGRDPGSAEFTPAAGLSGYDAGPGSGPGRIAADPSATAERPRMLDLPTGPASEHAPRFRAEPIDRAALRRPPGPTEPVGGVYSTRRPAMAVLLAVLAVLLEIPALQLVFDGAFGDTLSASAVISGSFLMVGLPAFALGLYALVTGAGRRPDQPPGTAWLRPPLAYLPVGLVLFIAAALAAG
jgi:hypothetical protein